MKERIKRIGKHCFMVMGSPVTLIAIIICCCGFFSLLFSAAKNLVLWRFMVTLPEPEQCVLCTDDGTRNKYPCLVKLETGEIGQIRIFDAGSEFLEGNNQFEETGFWSFAFLVVDSCASNTITAGSSTSNVPIHKDAVYINPYLYCHNCRAKIGEAIDGAAIYTTGYVIADLYDLDNIRIYPIEEDTKYNVRDYTVEISKDKKTKELVVSVTGYFE